MSNKSKGYENPPRKVYIRTFGCQMNEHDSAKMADLLETEGHSRALNQQDADIIIFNTCTVRAKPHHKAISEVGRTLKLKSKKPDLIVGIAGCVAQEEGSRLFELCPGLDFILGPDQIFRLPEMVKSQEARMATELIDNHEDYNFIIPKRASSIEHRVSSFIKIIKGCNNFCSFCIVPYVRGREVSKAPVDIIAEINGLCQRGVREVTLLGQNVNSYNPPLPPFEKGGRGGINKFSRLLRRIAEETGISRIRYTSPHPKDLSAELIEEHRTNGKLCEHIHLPVQAGSTSVLERMNRRYTREHYLSLVHLLKRTVPDIAVTTDLIVGFPGETDKDFEETLELMKEAEFDGMFAFKYSPRPGTKAAEYNDDVPLEVKKVRLSQVLELNEKIVLQKHEKYVGTRQEILVEGPSQKGGGQLTGRTRTNKVVNFDGDGNLMGRLADVEITWAGANSLRGSLIS